jgi:riboflavin kinase/FMN adenylyltransferase
MYVVRGLDNLTPGTRARAVCVGAFDGFHLGHQYLLRRLCALAGERGFDSGIVTFEPPPTQFFAPPGEPPRRLITLAERIALAESLCCDVMAILDLDAALAAWTAERFITQVLVAGLGTRMLVASSTHTMGHDRADIGRITELCQAHGLEVVAPPIMQLADLRVSSSAIRQALWEGHVEVAANMLGRHYSFAGRVVPGRGLGRELGFPTANVEPPAEKLIPREGVYAGLATDETPGGATRTWPAAISIGSAPTFGLETTLIEAHLLADDVPDLTGHLLRLEFVQHLREQRKFSGPQELAAQIARDVARTRELCHALTPGAGLGGAWPACPKG